MKKKPNTKAGAINGYKTALALRTAAKCPIVTGANSEENSITMDKRDYELICCRHQLRTIYGDGSGKGKRSENNTCQKCTRGKNIRNSKPFKSPYEIQFKTIIQILRGH